MFCLVEFGNGECCVLPSKNIRHQQGSCSAKYRGTWFRCQLVIKCENKSCLINYKHVYSHSARNLPKQLIPVIDKSEILNYLKQKSLKKISENKRVYSHSPTCVRTQLVPVLDKTEVQNYFKQNSLQKKSVSDFTFPKGTNTLTSPEKTPEKQFLKRGYKSRQQGAAATPKKSKTYKQITNTNISSETCLKSTSVNSFSSNFVHNPLLQNRNSLLEFTTSVLSPTNIVIPEDVFHSTSKPVFQNHTKRLSANVSQSTVFSIPSNFQNISSNFNFKKSISKKNIADNSVDSFESSTSTRLIQNDHRQSAQQNKKESAFSENCASTSLTSSVQQNMNMSSENNLQSDSLKSAYSSSSKISNKQSNVSSMSVGITETSGAPSSSQSSSIFSDSSRPSISGNFVDFTLNSALPIIAVEDHAKENVFQSAVFSSSDQLLNFRTSSTTEANAIAENSLDSSVNVSDRYDSFVSDQHLASNLSIKRHPIQSSSSTFALQNSKRIPPVLSSSVEPLTRTFNSTNNTDFSNNTISEYFPDTEIDITEEQVNVSTKSLQEKETSIDIIQNTIKLSDLKVPHKVSRTKKYFCLFCKSVKTKLPRHFISKHRSEEKVKEALRYPVKSPERLKIFEELRKQGCFLHNTSEDLNTGILMVSRQQQANSKNKPDDYICCKNCKAFFSKKTLRIHIKRCCKEPNSRYNFINGRKLTQYLHPSANYTLRTKVFPVLRDDEVTRTIRYDELIIKWGNWMTEKYTLSHQHDMIRARLRVLGRFLIEAKKIDNNISEMKDIYKPSRFETCVKALRKVANWDESLMWFKTPANAQCLTSLIKKCGARLRSEYIKSEANELKKQLTNFILLWEEEVPVSINKKAFDDQCNKKRTKKYKLPSKKDIKILYDYLKKKVMDAITVLEYEFDFEQWVDLVKSSLIFIMIFNRRRAGEIERLTINSFSNQDIITDNIEKDYINVLSKDAQLYATQYRHLSIRGKRGRTVSVLLDPLSAKAIETIIKNRAEAGIPKSNEYVFSKAVNSKFSKPYYRACPLLKQFAASCGAEFPDSLTGTYLRKHIATHTGLLNVEESTVDQLANFMGHHKDIHKNIYRLPVPVAEITQVSKLLLAAIGGDEGEDDDSSSGEESDDFRERETPKRKKRSTSPFGKTKRLKWSAAEIECIKSAFGPLEKLEKLPSTQQCLEAIQKYPALKKRTPLKMKSWIDNQRRYKLNVPNATTLV